MNTGSLDGGPQPASLVSAGTVFSWKVRLDCQDGDNFQRPRSKGTDIPDSWWKTNISAFRSKANLIGRKLPFPISFGAGHYRVLWHWETDFRIIPNAINVLEVRGSVLTWNHRLRFGGGAVPT